MAVGEVVLDDVLDVRHRDQVVVDGVVLAAAGMEVDESLLTGESEPVVKGPGDEVLSGSFVVAGRAVPGDARSAPTPTRCSWPQDARRFTLARSELRSTASTAS